MLLFLKRSHLFLLDQNYYGNHLGHPKLLSYMYFMLTLEHLEIMVALMVAVLDQN